MHEPVPEAHERGVAAFVRSLKHKRVACRGCGFEANVLGGEWRTRVESSPLSGHVVYKLTCPDCNSVESVEINV